MRFDSWLNTFIDQKGIDPEQGIEVEGPSGTNHMPVGIVIDAMKQAPRHEQAAMKKALIRIDFQNGDPVHFIRHIAQAIAQ